jgi:hypothetical protein
LISRGVNELSQTVLDIRLSETLTEAPYDLKYQKTNMTSFGNSTSSRQRSRYSNSLRAGRSGDRIPVEARFSASLQTCSEARLATYTMVTGSFPGVKRPRRGVDHLLPSSAKVKERVELHVYSPFGLSWLVLGELLISNGLTLTLHASHHKYQAAGTALEGITHHISNHK